MTEQLCPVCGCQIMGDAYEQDDILYCCQSCATSGQCECGCCESAEDEDEQGDM